MGIRIRTDIFTHSSISADSENMQENPLKAVTKDNNSMKAKFTETVDMETVNAPAKPTKPFNIQGLSTKTVRLVMGARARAEKRKNEPEEMERNEKKSEETKINKDKNQKEIEVQTETAEQNMASEENIEEENGNNVDDGEEWFDARKFLIQMKSSENEKPKLDVVESTINKASDNIIASVKEIIIQSPTETKVSKSSTFSNLTKDTRQPECNKKPRLDVAESSCNKNSDNVIASVKQIANLSSTENNISKCLTFSSQTNGTVQTIINKKQTFEVVQSTGNKDSNNVLASVKEITTPSAAESDSLNSVRFSNHTKDTVQAVCQLCQEHFYFVNMRAHTRKAHQLSISDYKAKYGALKDHIVEEIYHECGICSKALLLDSDSMAPHVKSHGLTHKEYSAMYMTLRQHKSKWSPKKATTPMEKSVKDFSAQELLEQLQAMISDN